jgi:3-oxoacyl-[acyl-carrier protein] reductase/pteridine reductase
MDDASNWTLAGKVILVTGAARRIGRSIALRLASEGACVLIHYSTSREEAERTAAECAARTRVALGGTAPHGARLGNVSEDAAVNVVEDTAPLRSRLGCYENDAAASGKGRSAECPSADASSEGDGPVCPSVDTADRPPSRRARAEEPAPHGARLGNDEEDAARVCYRADLASVAAIERMFLEIAEREGRLDGLVNNAARFTRIDPLAITEADWDAIHNVNLKATFFCCQHAARLMLRDEAAQGRIVNISSMGAFLSWAEHAHYCASKAGVVALTRALAKAWAPRITVNSVAPGAIPFEEIDTPAIQALARSTPVGRAGTGAEVANAVHYFLTASNFVTGQTLQVDGGMGLR